MAKDGLKGVTITSVNILKSLKEVDITKIYQSNRYYAKYSIYKVVEKVAWSSDRILNIYSVALRIKVRKGLVRISPLDTGGPLVL